MNMKRPITLHLDAADYDRLAALASEQRVPTGELAARFVRTGLHHSGAHSGAGTIGTAFQALDELAALRERLPDAGPVDAAVVVREARAELERRTAP
jgi:hypothetical protein